MDELVFIKEKAVLGFRKWRWDDHNDLLYGISANIPWQPGINYSFGCTEHASPITGCHCGFNAYFERNDPVSSSLIHGAMAGSGRLEIHRTGFRSSEAQLLAVLDSFHSLGEKADIIVSRYGVPVFSDEKEYENFLDSLPVHSPEVFRSYS